MKILDIARVAYEVNRAYCESLGDMSFGAWEDAPDWQKSTLVNGVVYHLDHPDATPEGSHENWLAFKAKEGWTHGPVKDPVKKTHPCFVPFSALPQDQKSKDYLFRQVVHSLKPFLHEVEEKDVNPTT